MLWKAFFKKYIYHFGMGIPNVYFFYKKKLLSGKVYLEPISIVTKERSINVYYRFQNGHSKSFFPKIPF